MYLEFTEDNGKAPTIKTLDETMMCAECFETYKLPKVRITVDKVPRNCKHDFTLNSYMEADDNCSCGGSFVPVDTLIVKDIVMLNKKGYYTFACCCGHIDNPDPYISFSSKLRLRLIGDMADTLSPKFVEHAEKFKDYSGICEDNLSEHWYYDNCTDCLKVDPTFTHAKWLTATNHGFTSVVEREYLDDEVFLARRKEYLKSLHKWVESLEDLNKRPLQIH